MRPDFSQPLCVLPTYDLRPWMRAAMGDRVGITDAGAGAAGEPELTADGSVIVRLHGFICEGCPWGDTAQPSKVMAEIDRALSRGLAVTLDVDSPGGVIKGVPELAAYVRAAVKGGATIHAFTRGQCCSAAYWVASQCTDVTATRGAIVGNVGAYAVYTDWAEANAKIGVRNTLFASGDLKAAGHPDFPLTDTQRAFLAEHIDALAGMFFEDLFAARPQVDAEAVKTGGWWLADRARAIGLIDHVALDTPDKEPAQ